MNSAVISAEGTTAATPSAAALLLPARDARTADPSARFHVCGVEQPLPGQVVLVMQGSGALGAYHVGVYEALHDAGVEPDWVIGTSIGAVNAAIIAGNPPADRVARLNQFWQEAMNLSQPAMAMALMGLDQMMPNAATLIGGVPALFTPNLQAMLGMKLQVGIEQAAFYSTAPLFKTLGSVIDFDHLAQSSTRLTMGAVNANAGTMHYFDSSTQKISVEHVAASGALPPLFPAIRIDGVPYWDGGLYSNTPVEVVLDEDVRRDSLVFAVNVWQQTGPEPESIDQVMSRSKDLQFACRASSHIARQKQIHRLRHVIRELAGALPDGLVSDDHAQQLASWGCGTTMHVVHLVVPRLADEDQHKDIDFSVRSIAARRAAGYADMLGMLKKAPWRAPTGDGIEGVIEYR